MTTLKSLVDETTNIKNEIVECHSNLSSILTSKNVEVSEEDKMSDLIGKVDLLGEYENPILYLYKDGDECTDVTGGWSVLGGVNSNVTMHKNSNNITIYNHSSSSSDVHGGICTNLSIDVSSYSKVKAEVETVGVDCAFYVITSRNLSSTEYPAFITFGATNGEIEIDLSKVFQNVYFYIRPNNLNQSLIVKNIRLEK